MKTYIKLSLITVLLFITASCELERLEAKTQVAPGGGTLSEYTAYTIESTDPEASNVFGRIVFWKTDLDQTLAQVSLYNTVPDLLHPTLVLEGETETEGTTLIDMGNVSGETGELAANKLFLIEDTAFYDGLSDLDAHINIQLSETDDTIVATGNSRQQCRTGGNELRIFNI